MSSFGACEAKPSIDRSPPQESVQADLARGHVPASESNSQTTTEHEQALACMAWACP